MKLLTGMVMAALAAIALSAAPAAQGCTFALTRTTVLAGPEAVVGESALTASAPGCAWTAVSSAPWVLARWTSFGGGISGDGTVSGSGSSTIGFGLAANTTGATRTATLAVAGLSIAVTQQALPCIAGLTPSSLTFPALGFGDPTELQGKSVTVDAPADCHWSPDPWPASVAPLPPPIGNVGSKTVSGVFPIILAPGTSQTVKLGSVPLTLTRLEAPCVFELTPANPAPVSVTGASGTVNVAGTGTDCSFTATAGGSGLTITSQSAPAAPATITYTIAANTNQFPRQSTISVPNKTVTFQQNGAPARTDVTQVSFGGIHAGATITPLSPAEDVQLAIDEQPGSNWTVSVNQPWLVVTPMSGSGPARLRVSVDPAAAAALVLPSAFATYSANIAITAAFAPSVARTVQANLTLKAPNTSAAATGVFETPLNNATVSGATPVTGWAVDDINISRIQIYRDPVAGEGSSEIYIGDAIRVRGARPDIATRGFPQSRSAGWGYMLLTNVLPGNGNGTFTLSAYVDDVDGHRTLLGRRAITVDNANAIRPFGTIDEPAQGATVSGTIVNRGWVLTPQTKTIPVDGSTIKVYIDGALVSPVAEYGRPRPDVLQYFPGLMNSSGPEARLSIDTTLLSDGVHTIAWGVIDDAGAAEGIGSRYFTVQNGLASLVETPDTSRAAVIVSRLPALKTEPWSRSGVDELSWATRVETDAKGKRTLHATRGQRIELFLDPTLRAACGTYTGHLLSGEVAGPLPAGATLDVQHGIFRWQPVAETAGTFEFVFVQRGCDGVDRRVPLRVTIE